MRHNVCIPYQRQEDVYGNVEKYSWFSDVLIQLATEPFKQITIESDEFRQIETFVSKLYSTDGISVNQERKSLFCHTTQDFRRLPPTRDALLQHCKRVIYQGGIWTQAHDAHVFYHHRNNMVGTKKRLDYGVPFGLQQTQLQLRHKN